MRPSIHTIVIEIRAAGWTQRAIAEEVGCTQPLISAIERTADYEIGETLGGKLRELHAQIIAAGKLQKRRPKTGEARAA